MIIHIWMHWFWITTAYFKVAEAGLLDNETFISATANPYNDSSQPFNITSPVVDTHPPITSSSIPMEETSTEESTTTKIEDGPRMGFDSSSDVEDTYSGGTVDVFQFPLKKFTKYTHLKYGKAKTRGKPEEEERKIETVKVVEEKVSINISGSEVDKTNDRPSEGNSSEVAPTSDAPDLITTTLSLENSSKDKTNGSEEKEVEERKLKNETLVIENKVEETGTFTTVESFAVQNRVAAATSAQNYEVEQSEMNAGSITGITLGILVIFSLFGVVSFVFYRRRYLNKPQVLHDKCSNLDSSGYIDETSLRENSEEMYSLDNDSFLNSLEAMTIQNYWTESVKHTKL